MFQPQFKTFIIVCILLHFSSHSYAQLGTTEATPMEPTDLDRVKADSRAPDFTLEDMEGKRVSLFEFRGKKKVVLVFYRGH